MESNHTARATLDTLFKNYFFYILPMYEFLHGLGHERPSQSGRGSSACPLCSDGDRVDAPQQTVAKCHLLP